MEVRLDDIISKRQITLNKRSDYTAVSFAGLDSGPHVELISMDKTWMVVKVHGHKTWSGNFQPWQYFATYYYLIRYRTEKGKYFSIFGYRGEFGRARKIGLAKFQALMDTIGNGTEPVEN